MSFTHRVIRITLLPSAQPAWAPCRHCCCWQLATAHVRPSQTYAQRPLRSKPMTSASRTQKQNVWSGFTLVSQSVSCCHAGKCILVFSKDLLTKYIVFCGSNLWGYLTHVVEWTGAIWPSSSFRSAVVVLRSLQVEKLDSCRMNHSEYLLTLTLCPAPQIADYSLKEVHETEQ